MKHTCSSSWSGAGGRRAGPVGATSLQQQAASSSLGPSNTVSTSINTMSTLQSHKDKENKSIRYLPEGGEVGCELPTKVADPRR